MADYQGEERRQCALHSGAMERTAAIETQLEMHDDAIAEIRQQTTRHTETMHAINVTLEKLRCQFASFETRWDTKSEKAKEVMDEYRAAMITIAQRFEAGDKKFDMLTEVNKNFEWFRTLMNGGRDNLVKGFIGSVLIGFLYLLTMHWTDIGGRMIKWVVK